MKIMHFQTRLYLLKKVDGSIYHKVFEFAMCFGTIASLHFVTGHPDPVQQDRILTLETGLNFLHRFIIFLVAITTLTTLKEPRMAVVQQIRFSRFCFKQF